MLLPPWQNTEDAGLRCEENGVTVENISLPRPFPGLFQGVTALRLTRRALALRPDVVHLFKPKAYSGLTHWLLMRLPRGGRPRLVVDSDDWEGPGGWNELAGYTPAQRRLFAWQERWGLTHADAVTVASRALESLVWATGVPPERVFYVPNGVGETEWTGNADARSEEPCRVVPAPCILLYTRFFEFPVSRVIEVFQRVRGWAPEARLLVVGEGLFGEEDELFQLAARSGWTVARPVLRAADGASDGAAGLADATSDVIYAGWVPLEMLPYYFAQADVAIYPFDDTLINRTKCAVKLRDLLAAGLPVVAEAVGQNREYIRHGETGLLVEPRDVSAFADAVRRLVRDRSLRKRLGQAAARHVRKRFAWEKLVDTVERAYGVRS
jgi:glycosyltransferase involved in cell wall biosynthesis